MDAFMIHFEANKYFYSLIFTVAGFALLWWLSRYFATKKEFLEQSAKNTLLQASFEAHQKEHYKLRQLVLEIDGHIKHLPSSAEISLMREEMALLRGRLEGVEPMFKQILTNQNILIENELRGDKK